MEEQNGTIADVLCGAKIRSGIPCQNWGMANGRCRMHGGKSTGAKTPEGRERIRQANWNTGYVQRRQESSIGSFVSFYVLPKSYQGR